jgi:Clp amino terminal domain, pathogenicity island component
MIIDPRSRPGERSLIAKPDSRKDRRSGGSADGGSRCGSELVKRLLSVLARREMLSWMFERFTESARMVVVGAQTCASDLKHNYIGTEHLLLALLSDREDVPAWVLASFGVDQNNARTSVVAMVGTGKEEPPERKPFTPGSKMILERGLREALELGHDDIMPGHLLLGLVGVQEGIAFRFLLDRKVPLEELRAQVVERLGPPEACRLSREVRAGARAASSRGLIVGDSAPAPDRELLLALRMAAQRAVSDGRDHYGFADLLAVAQELPDLRKLLDQYGGRAES